jgi:hypothetical protein
VTLALNNIDRRSSLNFALQIAVPPLPPPAGRRRSHSLTRCIKNAYRPTVSPCSSASLGFQGTGSPQGALPADGPPGGWHGVMLSLHATVHSSKEGWHLPQWFQAANTAVAATFDTAGCRGQLSKRLSRFRNALLEPFRFRYHLPVLQVHSWHLMSSERFHCVLWSQK